jgi:signal transduction histidine kinase
MVLLPGSAMVALGGGSVAWLLTAGPTGTLRTAVLGGALALALLILMTAALFARSAQRRFARSAAELDQAATDVANTVSYGDEQLRRALEDLRQGRSPQPPAVPSAPAEPRSTGGPFGQLLAQLEYSQLTAYTAVTEAADLPVPNAVATQQVTVLVNLARRLQSLVHQGIKILDELEQQVEDPDLLRGLFEVDHIATRIRRYVENVAVLGGEVTRRQWRKPVPLASVVRSAIGEVERYSRVKPVPPIDGRLDGAAVADVVHLLAELIENATAFSPPGTQVYVRTQRVTTGFVVEIEDRGLGQLPEDERMRNALLADPERVELGALLKDGRVGLYVVAVLARQHQIRVELRRNLFGGVTSLVLLPNPLLRAEDDDGEESDEQQTHARTEEASGLETRPEQSAGVGAVQGAGRVVQATPSAATTRRPQHTSQTQARPSAQPYTPAHAQAEPSVQAQLQLYGQAPAESQAVMPQRIPQQGPGPRHAQSVAPLQPAAPLQSTPAHPAPVYASPAQAAPTRSAAMPQASTRSAAAPQEDAPARGTGRPPLPQRTQQTHMAPQLQRQPQPQQYGGHGSTEEYPDYTPANPGLMATYRRGVRAAEEQSGLSGDRAE